MSFKWWEPIVMIIVVPVFYIVDFIFGINEKVFMKLIILLLAITAALFFQEEISGFFNSSPGQPTTTTTTTVIVGAPHTNNPPVLPMPKRAELEPTKAEIEAKDEPSWFTKWLIENTPKK